MLDKSISVLLNGLNNSPSASFAIKITMNRDSMRCLVNMSDEYTVGLQWLEHLWNHEIMFETGVVRINEC